MHCENVCAASSAIAVCKDYGSIKCFFFCLSLMDVIMLLALKGNQFSVHAQYELSILINEDEVSVSDWLEK